jgi:protein-S-isoprenylcysteine O-methyltransferase Ste14
MRRALRQLAPILLMPMMVTVGLPYWLLSSFGGATLWQADGTAAALVIAGAVILCSGLALFLWCLSLFITKGRGTIAPWDPTKQLVVSGPYRLMRNPMITGVALVLLGEALLFGSAAIGLWFLFFLVINHAYFILSEEPGLEKRFGKAYRTYRAVVPRWLPRMRVRKG